MKTRISKPVVAAALLACLLAGQLPTATPEYSEAATAPASELVIGAQTLEADPLVISVVGGLIGTAIYYGLKWFFTHCRQSGLMPHVYVCDTD